MSWQIVIINKKSTSSAFFGSSWWYFIPLILLKGLIYIHSYLYSHVYVFHRELCNLTILKVFAIFVHLRKYRLLVIFLVKYKQQQFVFIASDTCSCGDYDGGVIIIENIWITLLRLFPCQTFDGNFLQTSLLMQSKSNLVKT